MKKKPMAYLVSLILVIMALAGLTACNKVETGETDTTAYVGLFSFSRTDGGVSRSVYLILEEDKTFYYTSAFLSTNYIGTYSYNVDKTKLTLAATNKTDINGEFVVEKNAEGRLVIKQIPYMTGNSGADDGFWRDDLAFDSTSTPPAKAPIELISFFKADDEDSKITFFTENKYELLIGTPEILSTGTYVKTTTGNSVAYVLTDTLSASGLSYTFGYSYTSESGYSSMVLKGSGITDANGIAFMFQKDVSSVFSGSAVMNEGTPYEYTESATLILYLDGTFDIKFTIFGNAGALASGTWVLDATYATTCTVIGGDFASAIVGGKVILSVDLTDPTYATTGTLSVKVENVQPGTDCIYSIKLSMKAE